MKVIQRDLQMNCTLTLTEREAEMLGYLAGFGGEAIAERITAHLTGQFPKKEWISLWNELRTELESISKHFSDTRSVFAERKRAVPLSPLS